MANISISQMDTRAVANLSDLFEVAYADEQSSTGYASGKMSAEVIANGIVNSYTYTSAMPNMGNRTLAGAMNTMLEGFAPAYDDTQTYAVGDYCTYAGKMYICSTAVTTAGAWDSTKWTETTCAEEFGTDVVVDSALSTTSENPVQNKVITQNINSINANLVSEKTTAKADIVSITDAQDIPAEDVKADIEPIQDLHGYEYPWVGGAGKNLLDYDTWKTSNIVKGIAVWENNGVTLTATNNDCYISTGDKSRISVTEGQSVTISWEETTNKSGNIYILPNGSNAISVNNANVKKITYTPTSGITYIEYSFGVNIAGDTIAYKNIQIEQGTQATSYSPYSNICPISGYDECNVVRTGVNQWDEQWENGYYDITTGEKVSGVNVRCKNPIRVIEGQSYYFRQALTTSNGMLFYDINNNYISYIPFDGNISITIPNGVAYITFYMSGSGYGGTYNNDISINYPSTVTTYQPYQGQTYTVEFKDDQDNPMTVYSGTLDVTTGVLTVDRKMVDMGDLSWSYSSANAFFYTSTILDIKQVGVYGDNNIISSQYIWHGVGGSQLANGEMMCNSKILHVKDTRYTDATAFKTAMDGVQLLYELATPQVYNLTPTQIDMLLNNNILSASTGKIQVKYQPANVIGELKKLIYQLTNQ